MITGFLGTIFLILLAPIIVPLYFIMNIFAFLGRLLFVTKLFTKK